MFRISHVIQMSLALALASTPACNLILGNEDGILVTDDPVDAAGSESDAALDSDAPSDPPDTSLMGSDAPDSELEGSVPDVALVDAVATDGSPGGEADVSRGDADGSASSCEAGASICVAGQTASEMQACGPCGRGVQTRSRTCVAGGCGWGPWTAWGTCSVVSVECMPGQVGSETQACGPCDTGTQARTRTCTASCTWGAWGSFGTCGNITAQCLPDHWRCCGAGRWEWCYFNSCKWTGDCAPCNGSCSCP